MLTEADIREALRACYYGTNRLQHPRNIVELGLIQSIALAIDADAPGAGIPGVPPRQRLALTLYALSADADAQTLLRAQIENRLAGLPQLSNATISFVPRTFQILNTM